MLELAGRIRLPVDVRDLLELQRPFERDRVVKPPSEEQSVLLLGEFLGPGDDRGLEREHRPDRCRQMPHSLEPAHFIVGAQSAAQLGERQGEQE